MKKLESQPKDPSVTHFRISLVKSFIRIVAGVMLIKGMIVAAGALIIVAEFFGIAEEIF